MEDLDNAELERSIRETVSGAVLSITKDVARLEGIIEAHRGDAYAHRQMVAAYEPQQQEWLRWRTSVDVKLAALVGGLTVFAFVISVFGALIATRIFR